MYVVSRFCPEHRWGSDTQTSRRFKMSDICFRYIRAREDDACMRLVRSRLANSFTGWIRVFNGGAERNASKEFVRSTRLRIALIFEATFPGVSGEKTCANRNIT